MNDSRLIAITRIARAKPALDQRQGWSMTTCGPTGRLSYDGPLQVLTFLRQQGVGFRHRDGLEAQALPRVDLADPPDVEGADRGHLRVAARGLAVYQEDDRLALADHLDPAERDA